MNAVMLGLLAETSLHPGSETSGGVVDLPVAREAVTSYPVLMSSGLKGALRDAFENCGDKETAKQEALKIFGGPNSAGGISITDGRLLLLPIRSLTGNYRWVTCPYILERFERDLKLGGLDVKCPIPDIKPARAEALAFSGGSLYLEELSFTLIEAPEQIANLTRAIERLICHQVVRDRLAGQIVVVHDDEFRHFASFGLPVHARNLLDDTTKISRNLWYEETVPSDSLFYALLFPRSGKEDQLEKLEQMFSDNPYLQVGGNETIGQGWCVVSWCKRG